jgi:ATP synthase protein I
MAGGESNDMSRKTFDEDSAKAPGFESGNASQTHPSSDGEASRALHRSAHEAASSRMIDPSAANHTGQQRSPQQDAMAEGRRDSTASSKATSVSPAAAHDDWDVEQQDNNIVPLTRVEAEQLFGADVSRPSRVTPFKVVAAQMVVSLVAALICWQFLSQPGEAARSALLGGAVCWVPGALFALRLRRVGHQQSVMGLMVGEAIKMGVTVTMFVVIAEFVPDVRWLPLLLTYLVALKTYWVALALR